MLIHTSTWLCFRVMRRSNDGDVSTFPAQAAAGVRLITPRETLFKMYSKQIHNFKACMDEKPCHCMRRTSPGELVIINRALLRILWSHLVAAGCSWEDGDEGSGEKWDSWEKLWKRLHLWGLNTGEKHTFVRSLSRKPNAKLGFLVLLKPGYWKNNISLLKYVFGLTFCFLIRQQLNSAC